MSLLQEFERPDNHGNALLVRVRRVRHLATFSGSSEQSGEQRELLQGGEGNSDQTAYKVGYFFLLSVFVLSVSVTRLPTRWDIFVHYLFTL